MFCSLFWFFSFMCPPPFLCSATADSFSARRKNYTRRAKIRSAAEEWKIFFLTAFFRKLSLTNGGGGGIIPTQNKEERQHPFSPLAKARRSMIEKARGRFAFVVRVRHGCARFCLVKSFNGGASVLARMCISSMRTFETARSV